MSKHLRDRAVAAGIDSGRYVMRPVAIDRLDHTIAKGPRFDDPASLTDDPLLIQYQAEMDGYLNAQDKQR